MAVKRSIRFVTTFIDGVQQTKKILATALQINIGKAGIVATQDDGFIDPSLLKNSEVKVVEASEAIAAGDEVNIFDDSGPKVRKATASGFATRSMGYAEGSAAMGENVNVISEGCKTGLAGLTIGEPVFLGIGAGAVTQTPPTADNEIWQMLGEATKATEYRLEIGEAIIL